MPLDPLWIPTGAGSQLLHDLCSELDADTTPLTTGAEIQAALDDDKENGRRLELDGGEITYTTTIDRTRSGGGLFGKGRPEPLLAASDLGGLGSTLIYNGTKAGSEAAIRTEGTDLILRDLVIQGKSTADVRDSTGTNTPRGLHIDRGASLGAGKVESYNVRWSGFDTAIVCGEDMADLNCDESRWISQFSHKNGTFFQARNAQCLGHRFWGLRVGNTDTVFDYKGGGKLSVKDCDILSPTTLLHLDGTDADGFGQNFSKWTFENIDLDSGARNTRLLTCTEGDNFYGSNIIFRGVHLSTNEVGAWDNELINVGENMIVQVEDCTNLCEDAIRWNTTGSTSIIHIRHSRVWTDVSAVLDLFDVANSVGDLRCIVENCYQHNTSTLFNSGTFYNTVLTGTYTP